MDQKFANETLAHAYQKTLYRVQAIRDSIEDMRHRDGQRVIYDVDFSGVYSTATPRSGRVIDPISKPYDFFSKSAFENINKYKSVCGFQFCYSEVLLLELMDQISHRVEFYSALSSPHPRNSFREHIIQQVGNRHLSRTNISGVLGAIIEDGAAPNLATGLAHFKELIDTGCIRDIFDFVDPALYYRSMRDEEAYAVIDSDIDRFRRDSDSGDDQELHKACDVFRVLTTLGIHADEKSPTTYYVGQERLRKIFPNTDNYSRGMLSPHFTLQSLAEIPSEANLHQHFSYNSKSRLDTMEIILQELLEFKDEYMIPFVLADKLGHIHRQIDLLIYGKSEMKTRVDYDKALRTLDDNPKSVRDSFARAADDAKSAEQIVREVAATSINEEFREVWNLRPNDRVQALFRKFES